MAFVRSKTVRGKKYYQLVRNYREKGGKHRQEVILHLRYPHQSLRSWIEEEERHEAEWRDRSWEERRNAKRHGEWLLIEHRKLLGGYIPSQEYARARLDEAERDLDAFYALSFKQRTEERYQELEEKRFVWFRVVFYHSRVETASEFEARADEHQVEKKTDC